MIVTFVSQCEKNAIAKTRRVIDAFADRIGDRVWQTAITQDGLNAVKKLLRKTASKNTAVSCHLICGHRQSKLVWIVGNRQKFNAQGIIPVNSTGANIIKSLWENDWLSLSLIKSLCALAGLFHDWGKASDFFQKKLRKGSRESDPIRHEWISVLLLKAFVNGDVDDEAWLERLSNGAIDEQNLQLKKLDKENKPFENLPSLAKLIAWLIVSHHRVPLIEGDNDWRGEKAENLQQMLNRITKEWGYAYSNNELQKLKQCFIFSQGLPSKSNQWLEQAKKWAAKMLASLELFDKSLQNGSWRLILHYARLSLMLGDHHYSSKDKDKNWQSEYELLANTYQYGDTQNNKGAAKQKLDEHLVGVTRAALHTAALLPLFESEPPRVYDNKALKKSSIDKFNWQDQAVKEIKAWQQNLRSKDKQYGFFAVNMASTGCGKTFANAKIMLALSPDNASLRYILALGLRTLTLQTGDEYRERIGLDNSELGVLIGSQAVMDLHKNNKEERESESEEELLDDSEIDYECSIPEDGLTTILRNNEDKAKKFLYAPVLACTIDHLMAATETKRGGRYILPSLRLMSSDLVIDEIDDFYGKDLIAIGRLIHLAGMLGRKVMISSATIPPALAEGYFNAYREGWLLFAKTRELNASIGCAWFDEFGAKVDSISDIDAKQAITSYKQYHHEFTKKRVTNLINEPIKRKAEIISCEHIKVKEKSDEITIQELYFKSIKNAINHKHEQHNVTDKITQKKVSFGLVRFANISPCIAAAKYLINTDWPENVDIKIMAYHARQVLLMRSEQEKHLDEVLKRGGNDSQKIFANPIIRKHLNNSQAANVIFILVATPVEEVGRDHDFDWAVVEPSSFRSIIQLAGRVLRHRQPVKKIIEPNIALMQYNLKALKNSDDKVVFCRPGYESDACKLMTHDLNCLVDSELLLERVDAEPRVLPKNELNPKESLIDLEHSVLQNLLTNYDDHGPETMQGWLTGCWWMTSLPQNLNEFREGAKQLKLFLIPNKDEEYQFIEKNENGEPHECENLYDIKYAKTEEHPRSDRLWLERNYHDLLEICGEQQNISIRKAALKYGEIAIYEGSSGYVYAPQFGLCKKQTACSAVY